jgi:hypothetical protein
MTKKEEEIINNRMIFYIGISMIFGDAIVYADNLSDLLRDFTEKNINNYYSLFKLIYDVKYDKVTHKVTFSEPSMLRSETIERFNSISRNFNNIKYCYDKVDQETVDKLSFLAEKFGEHLIALSNVKHELLIQ